MPSGALHALGYNAVNLEEPYTPPGGAALAETYNLDRQRTRLTLPGGRTVDNRFDAGGRLIEMADTSASTTFAYNGATERVSTITRTPSGGTAQTLGYSYDGHLLTGVSFGGVSQGQYRYRYDNNFFVVGMTLDGDPRRR